MVPLLSLFSQLKLFSSIPDGFSRSMAASADVVVMFVALTTFAASKIGSGITLLDCASAASSDIVDWPASSEILLATLLLLGAQLVTFGCDVACCSASFVGNEAAAFVTSFTLGLGDNNGFVVAGVASLLSEFARSLASMLSFSSYQPRYYGRV